jgi:hypothetical protein
MPRDIPIIASFSIDFPFFNLVTSDVCYVGKEEYLKVNTAYIDGG